jgi:hypothetical protein
MIEEARKKGKVQTRSSERENQVDASCRSANLVQRLHSKEHDPGSDREGTHSLEKASAREEIRGKTPAWLHVLRRATRQKRLTDQDGIVRDSAPNKGETRLYSAPIPILGKRYSRTLYFTLVATGIRTHRKIKDTPIMPLSSKTSPESSPDRKRSRQEKNSRF